MNTKYLVALSLFFAVSTAPVSQVVAGSQENAIAVTCAVRHGAEPTTTTGCIAGGLVANDLRKCLNGDCLGEGHEVSKAAKKIKKFFGL